MALPILLLRSLFPDTLSRFDISVPAWHAFLSQHGSRDKVGKVVHYGARGIAAALEGLAARLEGPNSRLALVCMFLSGKFRALFKRVMNARRTVRWLSGTGLLLPLLPTAYGGTRDTKRHPPLLQAARVTLLGWHISDHFRWLQQIGWVTIGDQAATKRVGFSSATLSFFLSFCHHFGVMVRSWRERAAAAVVTGGGNDDGVKEQQDRQQRRLLLSSRDAATLRNIIKFGIMTISAAHISELWPHSEAVCGIFGAGCAAIDVYNLWPRVKDEDEE